VEGEPNVKAKFDPYEFLRRVEEREAKADTGNRDSQHPEKPTAAKPEMPRPLMREMPKAEPFPVESLGAILGNAARAINDRVQSPMALCGNSVLATATLAAQAHVDVVLPIGNNRAKPISGYFITIAETGERKTESDHHAMPSVRERERQLRDEYDAKRESYVNDKVAWDKARDEVVKQSKGNRLAIKAALDKIGPPPIAPLEPMLTSTEPTFEGLCKQSATHQPSLGIFNNEGGQFIGGHGMKDENKLRTAGGLSELWDGQPARRVRAGDGASMYPGRRVSGHIMVQPEVSDILLNDPLLASQGLLSRLLVVQPESAAGTRMPRKEKPETAEHLKKYNDALLKLMQRQPPLRKGKANELEPRPLPLSVEANTRWFEFVEHVEKSIGRNGELEPIKGFANKMPEHAARLAAVLTVVENINAHEISVETLERGIALAEHYATEALRIFEAARANKDLVLAQRLLHWMQQSWNENAISLPDIYQRSLNAIRDKATAARLVAILVDHGWLKRIEGGAEIDGHYRREAWEIVKVV
jgi:Protein of unknown function (DUF3987)